MLAAGVVGVVALSACSSSPGQSPVGVVAPPPTAAALPPVVVPTVPAPTATTPPITAAPTPTTVAAAKAGWTVVSTSGGTVAVDQQTVTNPDGSHVVVARFHHGTFRLGLHAGSGDPPTGGAALTDVARSTVAPSERPLLLAAFNGGFKISAHVGGFEVGGHVLSPLVNGEASVVIDANGTPTIGIWGRDEPRPGATVVSVRQNLPPLVDAGRASATIDQVPAWGPTIGNRAMVARSALAVDQSGDLLYAGSVAALPADLATTLLSTGATTAMELDINPQWVQLDTAATAGGPLSVSLPGQTRPADQYLSGWTRDFFTVLSAA